jgi:outer membrane protein OmpA-like peptidoglycan-associated protein
VEIELSGHTDNRGSYRALMDLSQKRVNQVKQYLISKGIEARRITGKGYGGTRPVASNDTEETRQLNRRVEFTIKKT